MTSQKKPYCALCGRRQDQVKQLLERGRGHICDDCDSLRIKGATEAAIRRERDASINDKYRRHDVEVATQSRLRSQFRTQVANPKDPDSPSRAPGNEQGNGLSSHPLLGDKVQFNGANENMVLPNMDVEQWEKYMEHQLQKQNEKRLERVNQQTMRPNKN